MRLWHLLHETLTETTSVQPIMSSYPQPNSMLYSQGTVHNNTPFSAFISLWNYINISNSPTTYIATVFLLGPIMTWLLLSIAMKNGSCRGLPWNILMVILFLDISILFLLSIKAVAISFQKSGSCSPLDWSD